MFIKCSGEEKLEEFKKKCERNLCSIRRVDRVRKSLIREGYECELSVLENWEEGRGRH